jgi:hypothetical protein
MFNLLRNLYDDYLKTHDNDVTKKYFETHHAVLLKSTKEMYAAQRTALSLHHQLYTKFSKREKPLRDSPVSIARSVDFLSDGGIMEGNFLANNEFKGVYFRPESGVVEAGHFKNKALVYGLRICENGDFEEGLFVNCVLVNGIRYLLNGKFQEMGTRSWESDSDSKSDSDSDSLEQDFLTKQKKAAERKHLDALLELDEDLNDRYMAEYDAE